MTIRKILAGAAATGLAVVTTERHRRADHNTLRHGELVMQALTTAVRELMPDVEAVVAKGGITSAELARTGVGASRALVRGQALPCLQRFTQVGLHRLGQRRPARQLDRRRRRGLRR